MSSPNSQPTAFDAFATDYDADFTATRLGRLLRARVWQTLAGAFQPGQHILELTCGTGEDSCWLAQRGVRVTATDGSAEMVRVARAKAERVGVGELVRVEQLSLQELRPKGSSCPAGIHKTFGSDDARFDGLLSNFGGLNTIGDWAPLAEQLAQRLKPSSLAVLVPMGPVCPWEIGWHALHLEPRTALRRFAPSAPAKVGATTIPIFYPSARRLRQDFAPWFEHLHTESLGLWLPPSYLDHLVDRWPALFNRLAAIEQKTARWTGGWGDHYICVLRRRN